MFRNKSNKFGLPMLFKGLFFLVMAALFIFILGNVITYLWNTILVEVTGFKAITFWQAIGIFVLSRILFGGFKTGHRRNNWKRRGKKKFKAKFDSKMKDKWINMDDDERAAMKENWKDWCKKRD